jgi:alpha-galactosidase
MAGLNPTRMYKVHELNRIDLKPLDFEGQSFSGAYLMSHGLDVPYRNEPEWNKKSDWSSRVLLLEAE